VYLVTHATQLGGAERVLMLTAKLLQQRGVRVVIGCPGGRLADTAEDAGLTTVALELPQMHRTVRPREAYAYWKAARAVKRTLQPILGSADLIHAFSPVAALFVLGAAREAGTPLILHLHDAQRPRTLRRQALRLLSKRARHVIFASRTVAASLDRIAVARRASILTPPVDTSFLAAPSSDTPPTHDGPGPVVAMFGQLVPWKGQDVFLAAAAQLSDRLPDARYLVVGEPLDDSASSTDYIRRLHSQAAGTALAGRVSFVGFEQNPAALMTGVDVVVHASLETEAFGLVVAEAVSLGKAVVASDVGGPREIRDLVGGGVILYPPGDAPALADAIVEATATQALASTEATRLTARRVFSPEAYAEGLLRIYEAASGARAH
jgi:glycosyltransferase involved in cell wall biosynthesis